MAENAYNGSNILLKKTGFLPSKVTMSGKLLELFLAVDGHTYLSNIAQKLNMDTASLMERVDLLVKHGFIEHVTDQTESLPSAFYKFMAGSLSQFAGPMAQIMIEEAVMEVSDGLSDCPKNKGGELIKLLGDQIRDPESRNQFIKEMLHKLREY